MASRVVDFRSDTVTEPTNEMREAMRSAKVGDDVFGDDPTVNELQERAAQRMGMEAALFVPSGTMGNEIAVFVHTKRQGEILVEAQSHIVLYESGGPAVLSGVQTRTLQGERGVFTARQVAEALRDPTDPHEPLTAMVGIENTHNLAGGTVWTAAQTKAVAAVARENRIPLHVDGARIFNSAVAQGVDASSLVREAQSVMFCLSKGLSAPIGSVLCGTKAFIAEAHRVRKLFGGGMRQVGVIAAAGIVALEKMVDRLREDHENARRLAAGLGKIPGFSIDLDAVQTNMVFADVSGTGLAGKELAARLETVGVRAIAIDPRRVRFVTHRHIQREDVTWALERVAAVLTELAPTRRRGTRRD